MINVPVGALALALLARTGRSPRRHSPMDIFGLVAAVVTMGALNYGVIEAGDAGFGSLRVVVALGIAVVAGVGFVVGQRRGRHPMVPPALFTDRTVTIVTAVGCPFMVGYYEVGLRGSHAGIQHRHPTPLKSPGTSSASTSPGLVDELPTEP